AESGSRVATLVELIWARGADGVCFDGRGSRGGIESDVPGLAGARGAGAADGWAGVVEYFGGARRLAREIAAANGNFSDFDLPGLRCTGISSRGAGMDGAGAEGRVLEGNELFAVV